MRRELVVLAVAHLNKDESQRLLSRVSGAGAFGNAPRSVIGFARDPDDPDGEMGRERVIVHAKSNWGRYATSLAARIESRDVDTDDGERADVGYLVITGESSVGIDDLQRGGSDDGHDCEEAVAAALADGPRPSREIKTAVTSELGCSRKTVQRAGMRLRERGELVVEEGGFPRTTTWTLAVATPLVGTRLVPRGVPTEQTRMDTRDAAPNGHSGDSGDSGDPTVVGPSSNGHDPDAELPRLTAKFPDLGGAA